MAKAIDSMAHLIRGIIALALIGAVIGLIVFNPIISSVAGGLFAASDLQSRAVDEVRERNFRTSCALYKDASTWERWTTPMFWTDSWCEAYIGRM